MNNIIYLSVTFLISFILTMYSIKGLRSFDLMDVPNERSSHSVPTPTGGGIVLVIVFFFSSILFLITSGQEVFSFIMIFGACVLLSLLSFLDDRQHISPIWRLCIHFLVSIWCLFLLGGFPPIEVFGYELNLHILGYVFALFYLVWLINLYNFMDGIDGLAGIEAVTTTISISLLLFLNNITFEIWLIPLILCAATTGFLFHNFPKAKIFLGDAGSSFLGITFGLLSIQHTFLLPQFFWVWLILLGIFIVDATTTLFFRIINGKKFYLAHQDHAYQSAAKLLSSHITVSLAIGLINMLWLFPIAYLVSMFYLDGIVGLLIAYCPLIVLGIFFKLDVSKKIRSN